MTFIAIFPDGKTIYTIHEVQDYDGQGQNSGAVSRWLKGRNVFGKPEMNKMEVVYNILAPVVSDSKTKSGNGLSEIDILQQF